jgi:tRNA (guanine10-N2)-dimethyltransferase
MKLVFYLSGENETLPKSEVTSLLINRGLGFELIFDFNQLLVCKVQRYDASSLKLLGMTHSVLEFLGDCKPSIEEIKLLAKKVKKIDGSFSIRVKKLGGYGEGIRSLALEKIIGDIIEGEKVDLENPETEIFGFLTPNRFILSKLLIKIDKGAFMSRSPQFRPFFHPTSLSPQLARTLCNICGVSTGKRVLDHFCGSGGILIEAGLLGAEVFGIDIDKSMVDGAKKNLNYYGIRGNFITGDSFNSSFNLQFDIVITDPPYGRSSSTKGENIEDLFRKAMDSMYHVLTEKGVAGIISPDFINIEAYAQERGFSIKEIYILRVHGTLTRKICILTKS